jgi:hypothetical protein
MHRDFRAILMAMFLGLCLPASHIVFAQVTDQGSSQQEKRLSPTATGDSEQDVSADQVRDRNDRLAKQLTGVKFVGRFSVDGRIEQTLDREEYHIIRTVKLDADDLWTITARIKYGDHDMAVPMTMKILWAGETPVITVDQMSIPGFGTFDAYVLIRDGKYSGTWKHNDVGGHLIGEIIPMSDDEKAEVEKQLGRRRSGNEKSGQ